MTLRAARGLVLWCQPRSIPPGKIAVLAPSGTRELTPRLHPNYNVVTSTLSDERDDATRKLRIRRPIGVCHLLYRANLYSIRVSRYSPRRCSGATIRCERDSYPKRNHRAFLCKLGICSWISSRI